MEQKMIEITCNGCGTRGIYKKGKLEKLTCSNCAQLLVRYEGSKAFVSCSNCACINVSSSAFGWKSMKCKSCGLQVPHPALLHKGGRSDRGVKYPEMITFKCSKDQKKDIEALGARMGTTMGAVTRYLLNISLDRLQ